MEVDVDSSSNTVHHGCYNITDEPDYTTFTSTFEVDKQEGNRQANLSLKIDEK